MLQQLIGAALLAASGLAFAGCPQHYVEGRAPQIRNERLVKSTQELCYKVFGIMHSGVTRTPLWSAEHLTARNIAAAGRLSRENSFHPEARLPRRHRAELADYSRSGFDRGHMAPNGDMPDRESQQQSFSLANMVPQDAANNRNLWSSIEQAVRRMAKKEGGLYVLTGPAFIGSRLQKVGNVLVPTHLYKVAYSPRQRAGAAWFVANHGNAKPEVLSVAQLERRIGINLLPSLPAARKELMLRMPKMKSGRPKG
jgi:endonuclease G